MAAQVNVKVKHNGKLHEVVLDPSQSATIFKQTLYEKTGVPPERQKMVVKGGMLKDDTDMSKLNAKQGQTFMLIGTAGELPKGPAGPTTTFIEDLTDAQLALATKSKVGLTNLGNTCYLNSTLQVLRCIPELQTALNNFSGNMGSSSSDSNLTASLRDLFKSLGRTTEAFPPLSFLTMLRQVAPQFAEMNRSGGGYAQQDAEEVYVCILNSLQACLKGLPGSGADNEAERMRVSAKFIEQYMTGHMVIKRFSPEAPDEPPSFSKDPFTILQCNISGTTNEMTSGIMDSLTQSLEKESSSLGRSAVYNEESRIDRLPSYLTTHFVRFFWRRDINKKTKIMRKVKFPFELDTTPFLSDDLKAKVQATTSKIRAIEKERDERAKIRRKAKKRADIEKAIDSGNLAAAAAAASDKPASGSGDDAMKVDSEPTTASATATGSSPAAPTASGEQQPQLGAALTDEEELELRRKEVNEVASTVNAEVAADVGANTSALYELVGIVTHKGPAADAGHYMSWIRKDDDAEQDEELKKKIGDARVALGGSKPDLDKPITHEWYKFDDDRVTVVPQEKILTLDGGGEGEHVRCGVDRTLEPKHFGRHGSEQN
ncbi:deubiquitinating enzyme [Tilletia horrida]|uniref:Ubiquitin carboxyl-terminal hydrolase n=1 Tax=Tilletia horrida TaxID=155126 RepID=A0AAN6JPJ2_9BASI|nr:deubiquitinating enzyme [Tilletia horrida]KAK0560894.1 deubiquitinating enzyme [Tilletia horrida]